MLEIDNKSLTHRPDLWSHFGFVREISAILGKPISDQLDRFADDTKEGAKLFSSLGKGKSAWTIDIEPDCGCRHVFLGPILPFKPKTPVL